MEADFEGYILEPREMVVTFLKYRRFGSILWCSKNK